jgi:chaperone BCS1
VLDSAEKHEILADINEYLHPSTPRWYASRGIPLRRGYLFHGPPGTGKTSFSFAIAGIFGIDIYVVSLQDATVTEEDIALLFTRLPRRCIVLLEDIDTAGLRRDNDPKEDEAVEAAVAEENAVQAKISDTGDKKTEETVVEAKKPQVNGVLEKKEDDKATKKAEAKTNKSKKKKKKEESSDESESDNESSDSDSSDDEKSKKKSKKCSKKGSKNKDGKKKGKDGKSVISLETMSLSGLLNAIDGVASHEGRILIMTTNKPEELDKALVRPGRVDMQVGFTNATTQQAGELFHRMYENATPRGTPQEQQRQKQQVSKPEDETSDSRWDLLPTNELKSIADEFARLFPEKVFSPAEIQGFLLKRKRQPRKALEDAPGWIEGVMKQKATKSKIVTVQ